VSLNNATATGLVMGYPRRRATLRFARAYGAMLGGGVIFDQFDGR
jgi:hypothetical protein